MNGPRASGALTDEAVGQVPVEPISEVPGPALATLTRERFTNANWLFERKLDGMRVLAERSRDGVILRSRNGAAAGASFPEIVEALAAQHTPDFVVDGEVVAFDGAQTSFAGLQPRMHVSDAAKARRSGVEVFYYVFDLLHLDGHSARALALRDRKDLLRELFDWRDPLRFTEHRNADGEAYFREACAKGWEGIIAKRAAAPYKPGRTRDWLKFKCEQGQEFVIGGWTDPQGSRLGFGALLLGYFDETTALVYAGRVGTGFDRAMLASLHKRLVALERRSPAYDESTLPRAAASRAGVHGAISGVIHWATPELVAQVSFAEWTRDGQLRHPRFVGLREDKAARDVVRETPA
ncbi:MAG: non-homologous end-joining DNA ligase [Nocardioidaceae bacterium]